MHFALANDERTLFVFADEAETIAYCEPIDVVAGEWRFWDHAGRALKPACSQPPVQGRWIVGGGRYALHADPDADRLHAVVDAIERLEPNPFFSSLAQVREHVML